MVKIKHLIAGGCSFTQDGIGGVPPTSTSSGGCSFIHGDNEPRSWASHLAKHLNVDSMVNVAADSHGNILTFETVKFLVQKYNYTSADTAILLNVTDPSRFDIQCQWHDVDRSQWIPWNQNLIPWTYKNRSSIAYKQKIVDLSIDEIESQSAAAVESLFNFLSFSGFNFRFLMMRNYLDNEKLQPVLKKFCSQAILLPDGPDMFGFSKHHAVVDADGCHPSTQGHRLIAEYMLENIL